MDQTYHALLAHLNSSRPLKEYEGAKKVKFAQVRNGDDLLVIIDNCLDSCLTNVQVDSRSNNNIELIADIAYTPKHNVENGQIMLVNESDDKSPTAYVIAHYKSAKNLSLFRLKKI